MKEKGTPEMESVPQKGISMGTHSVFKKKKKKKMRCQ